MKTNENENKMCLKSAKLINQTLFDFLLNYSSQICKVALTFLTIVDLSRPQIGINPQRPRQPPAAKNNRCF